MPTKKKTKKYKDTDPNGWTRKQLVSAVNVLGERLAVSQGTEERLLRECNSLEAAAEEECSKFETECSRLRAELQTVQYSLEELRRDVLTQLPITGLMASYSTAQITALLRHELRRRDVTIEALQNELLRRKAP
jgi:hypothetical protein